MRLPLPQKPSILFLSCPSQLQEPSENCKCNSLRSSLSLPPVTKLTCHNVNDLNEIGGRWVITFRMGSIIIVPSSRQRAQWMYMRKTIQKCNYRAASSIMAASRIFKRLDRKWYFLPHSFDVKIPCAVFWRAVCSTPSICKGKRHETAFKTTCVLHIIGEPKIL